MSLRRAALLLGRGLRDATTTGFDAFVGPQLSKVAATSGRHLLMGQPSGLRHNTPSFASSTCIMSIRRAHGKADGETKWTAAELGLYWSAAAIFMVGLSYASVPLYKLLCAATGYGSGNLRFGATVEDKLKRRMETPDVKTEQAAATREVRVWFNADVSDTMPWEFTPTQEFVRVRPGQSTLVFFTARNKSNKPVTGYSLYNVTPDKAAFYFNKIQCFCFEEQRLRGGETIDMPVFFYIDPEFATDWNCRNINDITLSYIFHKVEDTDEDQPDDGAPTVVKLHSGPHPAAPGAANIVSSLPPPTAAAAAAAAPAVAVAVAAAAAE